MTELFNNVLKMAKEKQRRKEKSSNFFLLPKEKLLKVAPKIYNTEIKLKLYDGFHFICEQETILFDKTKSENPRI